MMGLDELDLKDRLTAELAAISDRMHRDARRKRFLEQMRLLLGMGASAAEVRARMATGHVSVKKARVR